MNILEIQPRFKEFLVELYDREFTHYGLDSDYLYLYNMIGVDIKYVDSIDIYKVLKFVIEGLG